MKILMLFYFVKLRIIIVVECYVIGEYEFLFGMFGLLCGKYWFIYYVYCFWEGKRIGEDVYIFLNFY